jgi:hypothetical protein
VLLFHEQVQFAEAVKCRAVFFVVIREGLLQPKECDTTLVFDCIAHAGARFFLESTKVRNSNAGRKPYANATNHPLTSFHEGCFVAFPQQADLQ